MIFRRSIFLTLLLTLAVVPAESAVAKGTGDKALALVALATARMQLHINAIHFQMKTPKASWSGIPAVKGLQATGIFWGNHVLNSNSGHCAAHFEMRVSMTAPRKFTLDEAAHIQPGHDATVYVRDVHGKKLGSWARLKYTKTGEILGPARYRLGWIAAYAVIRNACFSELWLKWNWTLLPKVKDRGVTFEHVRGFGDSGTTDLLIGEVDKFVYLEKLTSSLGTTTLYFAGFNVPLPKSATKLPPR